MLRRCPKTHLFIKNLRDAKYIQKAKKVLGGISHGNTLDDNLSSKALGGVSHGHQLNKQGYANFN